MPKLRVNNVELFYEEYGAGVETILFSHGFMMDHTMFQEQIDLFKEHFRVIAYDHRGHGGSESPSSGYGIYNLMADGVALIEALELGAVHFVGMSTGGFVGMRIALRRPELLKSLVLIDSSAEAEPPESLKEYNLMIKVVQWIGWTFVIKRAMAALFHSSFLKDPNRQAEVKRWRSIITGHDRKGMVAFGKGIFGRDNVLEKMDQVSVPTAVIVGEDDIATTPDHSQRMAEKIRGAMLFTIPEAGHTVAVEKPTAVSQAMQTFYQDAGIL
ncbi:MAG: alpha/beta fold hydrolase [Chloroflexi bacterium]|nr:alpha/beta fold hydrolase [Chloroflexota bacterium]